jgi:hypothetical protein
MENNRVKTHVSKTALNEWFEQFVCVFEPLGPYKSLKSTF